MKKIILASNNAHKIQEIKDILKELPVEIKSLKDENIDAVCICTPSLFHAPIAIEALTAGKMHKKQIVNFINAILEKEELVSDCYAGKKAVKVIKEIYKG